MNRREAIGLIGAFLYGCSSSRQGENTLRHVSEVIPSSMERRNEVLNIPMRQPTTSKRLLYGVPNVILTASANGSVSNIEESDALYREDSSYLRLSYNYDRLGTSDIYVQFPRYELAKYRSSLIKRAEIVLTLTHDFSTIAEDDVERLQSTGAIYSGIHAIASEWDEKNLRYLWAPACYFLEDYSPMGGTQPYIHRAHTFRDQVVWDITRLQYRRRVNEGKKIVSHWTEDPFNNYGVHITLDQREENREQLRTFYSRTNSYPPQLRLWFGYGSDS